MFFADRNLGRRFVEILRDAGVAIERHDDHFAQDTRDEDWIRTVASRHWVGITHDQQVRRRPNEKAAILDSSLRVIVVASRLPFPAVAEHFVRSIPQVERFLARHPAGPWVAGFYCPTPSELSSKRDPRGRMERWTLR